MGAKGVMQQFVIPKGQNMGMRLLDQYPLPDVAADAAKYTDRMVSYKGEQYPHQAIGSEWYDNRGNKALMVLQYCEIHHQMGVFWFYAVEMMKENAADFDRSKQSFLYALTHKEYNPEIIADLNGKMIQLQQKDFTMNMQHQQAMRDINRKGMAERNEINRQTDAYIQNLNRQSDAYRQETNDKLQEQFHNYMTDEKVVVSPFDGKEYKVETGAQTYWINDRGEYIKSDDLFFNPNDYEGQQGTWQKAPLKKY